MKKLFTVLIGIMMVVVLSAQHTNSYTYPLYVGKIGVSTGSITLKGITSGSAQLIVNAAAGSVVLTLPSTTGTLATTQNINDSLDAFVALGATLSDLAVKNYPDTVTTAVSRTLVLTDAGKRIYCTKATSMAMTIPPSTDVAWVKETTITFIQVGAGPIVFKKGTGVEFYNVLDSVAGNTKNGWYFATYWGNNNWRIGGVED